MSEFMVASDALKKQGGKLLDMQKAIMPDIIKEIDNICRGLNRLSINLNDNLMDINSNLAKINREVKQLGNSAIEIAMLYEHTDSNYIEANSESDSDKNSDDNPIADPTDATPSDDYVSPADYVYTIEYEYSEDNIQVPISIEFLNKEYCMEMANRIMEEHGTDGECNNMSTRRIAKEIYAHALGYYFASDLEFLGVDNDFIQGIQESGETADVGKGDGLEAWYHILWYWMDPFDIIPTFL